MAVAALIALLACAASGGGASTPPAPAARQQSAVRLPVLPSRGLAVPSRRGFVLTDAHGRVLVRRYGWRLDRSGYRSPFPLLLRRRSHEYAFDPAGPRLLPVAPGGDADLGGGYRLIYHHHHRWSVLAPDSREIWTIPGANVTVSADA